MYVYKQLRRKAAGHDGTLTDEEELLIFKPLVQQELEFYRAMQERALRDPVAIDGDVPLYSWLPTFLGVLDESLQKDVPSDAVITLQRAQTIPAAADRRFLVLENLLHGYSEPNILDLKLGKVLFDEKASEEKRSRLDEVSRNTTSGSLGFRICGMHLKSNKLTKTLDPEHYERLENDDIFVNKYFGRTRTKDNMSAAFKVFFADDRLSTKRIRQLKEMFLRRIQLLYNTMLDAEFRMISGSLLFIYEGDVKRWEELNDQDSTLRDEFFDAGEEESDDDNQKRYLSSLNLIDFAHTRLTPGEGYDDNVVDALESLIALFQELLI